MIIKSFIKALVIAGSFAFLVGGTVYSQINGTEVDVNKLMIKPSPTIIYDKNGNPFAQFHQQLRYFTPYKEIPNDVVNAIVAVEDRDFYQHAGVSVNGIARALITDIKAGANVQGGSTLTQQLVKRIYLNPGKTIDRKIQEAIYATVVEKEYTKQDIVALYLNHVYYGEDSYGVEDAIQTYFGETIKEFQKDDRINQIAKAALIAGMPQAPSQYDPYLNPQASMEKRNTVITKMMKEGYITYDEYEKAIKKPFMVLKKAQVVAKDEVIQYPEITHYVLEEARKTLGLDTLEQVMTSGTKIYTSFDPKIYKQIRKKFEDDSLHPANASDGTKTEAAAVFLNPQNGEILALTGSREQNNSFLDFNRAFQLKRQPGSTIKPVLDYGPAIESGKFTPWSLVASGDGSCFSGYCVKGGSSSPWATMDTALTNSWNVTAVWLLDQIGINYGKKFAERQGLKVFTDADKYLPIAIGGISKGVSPLDMANAYQGFATGGLKTDAHIIRRIVAHNGDIIHEADTELKRTMKEKTADYMRYMMRHVVLNGTGRNANVSPDDMISGKTGTTEVPWKGSSNNKDIWFVGYTKDYVGAIWMGFDNTDKKHSMPEYSGVPAKMFGEIIKPLLKEKPDPVSNYNEPTPVKSDINEFKASGELIDNTKQVKLKWGTDEEDVYYKVYRDGEEIAKTESGSYTDTGTEDGKSYSYKVMAFKNDSNIPILESNIISIKIPGKKDEEKPKENPTDTPNTSPDTPVTTEPTQTEPTDTNNTPVEPPADPATTTQPEQTDQTTVNQQAVTQPQAPETTPTDTTTTTNGN